MTKTQRLLAGLVVGTMLLTACEYREVDGVGTPTYDEEFVPQDDITTFGGCSRNQASQWQVDGKVTNPTPDMATYVVTIAFYDDELRLDERTLWIRDLAPDEVGEMNRGWWINSADRVTDCKVLTIDRITMPIAS